MATIFYAATSLDGYLADSQDSLDWLFTQHHEADGALNHTDFAASVGSIVMGSTTYEWVVKNPVSPEQPWPYPGMPSWVLTHRDLAAADPGVQFARGSVAELHAKLVAAAGDKHVWILGGGDLAAQFADAGLLDELWLYIAPVTLGEGRPLFPRRRQLQFLESDRNGDFLVARYGVGPQL